MPANDIIECKFFSQSAAQAGINVRHYRITAITPPEPGLAVIADRLSLTYAPSYRSVLSEQASFLGVSVRRIHPLPISVEFFDDNGNGVGDRIGDLLPKQVSGIITLRSGVAGRSNRGRIYIPFPSETDSSNIGRPTAGYVLLLDALAGVFTTDQTFTDLGGSVSLRSVVWRRGPRTSIDITNSITREIWATQRRRGDYGKPNAPPSTL